MPFQLFGAMYFGSPRSNNLPLRLPYETGVLERGLAKCEFSGCCRLSCFGLLSWNGTSLESGAMPVLVPNPVARSLNRTEELPGESTR